MNARMERRRFSGWWMAAAFLVGTASGAYAAKKITLSPGLFAGKPAPEAAANLLGAAKVLAEKGSWENIAVGRVHYLAGQKAENDFVGAPVGIMDQMASNLADETTALYLDTRSLRYEKVPLPAQAELLVINSGVSHRNATSEYRTRRRECEAAAELLSVPQLRDVGLQDLWRLGTLPEPLDRRARHVITENARVRSAVAALRERDLPRLGKLLAASHESLKNDFEVSVPQIDRLVELAEAEPDVFGARLTGGGFGGSIVVVTRRGAAREAGERIAKRYGEEIGKQATVMVPAYSPETISTRRTETGAQPPS